MGEPNGDEGKFLAMRDESAFVGADGQSFVEGTALSGNMNDDEVRETIAEVTGGDPDEIGLRGGPGEPYRFRNGRNKSSASFGTWNSPWRPGEQPPGDPTQN